MFLIKVRVLRHHYQNVACDNYYVFFYMVNVVMFYDCHQYFRITKPASFLCVQIFLNSGETKTYNSESEVCRFKYKKNWFEVTKNLYIFLNLKSIHIYETFTWLISLQKYFSTLIKVLLKVFLFYFYFLVDCIYLTINSFREALDLVKEAISRIGYNDKIKIALDVAAINFCIGKYKFLSFLLLDS